MWEIYRKNAGLVLFVCMLVYVSSSQNLFCSPDFESYNLPWYFIYDVYHNYTFYMGHANDYDSCWYIEPSGNVDVTYIK